MATELPPSPCVLPQARLMPRSAGAVHQPTRKNRLDSLIQPKSERRRETTSQLYRQIGKLLQSDVGTRPEAVVPIPGQGSNLIAEVLALSDEDVAEPIDYHRGASGDVAQEWNRAFITPLPPCPGRYPETGMSAIRELAKEHGFDMVYVVKVVLRSAPVSRYNPYCRQLVRAQLVAGHGLHLAPRPLRISSDFHLSVVRSGGLDFHCSTAPPGGVVYCHASACDTRSEVKTAQGSPCREHIIIAGCRLLMSTGNTRQTGLSTSARAQWRMTAQAIVDCFVGVEEWERNGSAEIVCRGEESEAFKRVTIFNWL